MHPSFTGNMSKERVERFQREATVMQLANQSNSNTDSTTGSHSFTHLIWYLLLGLHIQTSNQKRDEGDFIDGFQVRLRATLWMVGFIALGLGLLIGGFLYGEFGLLPLVLLTGIILLAVSIPILLRSVSLLGKRYQMLSHR